MPSLSIVIPAYNEESRLPPTLQSVLTYLDGSRWPDAEVLVVDDGSRDGTAALVEAHEDDRVRLVRNPGNRGKGYAVRNGMLSAGAPWRLFSDADLSAPIEELDRLMAAAERDGAEIAVGSRALDRSLISVHQSVFRENAGRVFNGVMQAVTGLPFSDTQCGFKLFSARAAEAVFPRQRLDGFGFDVEVLFIARKQGIRAVEVPVRWANVEGTKVGVANGLNSFVDLVRVRVNQAKGRYR